MEWTPLATISYQCFRLQFAKNKKNIVVYFYFYFITCSVVLYNSTYNQQTGYES